MLYLSCPTCGFFLGKKVLYYETEKDKICYNSKISKTEKEKLLSELLLSLKLRRYCCNMRFMTYKDLSTEIIT